MKKFFSLCWTLAGLSLLTGCEGPPRAIPPAFNLYGYQRLAVVPFENETRDPALAKSLQDEMTDQVLSLGAVPVVDAGQVGAYLRQMKARPEDLKTNALLRRGVAANFKCDLLLMGTVTGYQETLQDKMPEHSGGGWGFYTLRKVHVNGRAQLMDPASGSLLWSQKNGGYSATNTWNPLPIPPGLSLPPEFGAAMGLANLVKNRVLNKGDDEPAVMNEADPTILLYPKSAHFTKLREEAVFQLVNAFVEDFRGHGSWMPNLSPAK